MNWKTTTAPRANWRTIAYGNGRYVATNEAQYFMHSTDGITWTQIDSPDVTGRWYGLCFSEERKMFVAVHSNNGSAYTKAAYSYNGKDWYTTTSGVRGGDYFDLCYGNGKFVAIGKDAGDGVPVMYSYDGINWHTEVTGVIDRDWIGICHTKKASAGLWKPFVVCIWRMDYSFGSCDSDTRTKLVV